MNKEAQCRRHRQELDRSRHRHTAFQERGMAAMSRYDIEIAHGGRAEEALQTACWLVRNHIAYFTEKLTHCNEPVQQVMLFESATAPVANPDAISPMAHEDRETS